MFHSTRLRFLFPVMACALPLGGCWDRGETGPVAVSVSGTPEDLADPRPRLPRPAAKLMMEATAQGLVAFDAAGEIEPALAERWIVEDEGKSYIFRLREASWPDGGKVTAREVARLLSRQVKANADSELGPDLRSITEIQAMTGEVIEIGLTAPRPNFLQILAQPQMGIARDDGGAGPYRRKKEGRAWQLTPVADKPEPGEEAHPAPPSARRILRAERVAAGIVRFQKGLVGLVLGGRYSDLPLLNVANVERGAVRVDPVHGLFGLAVVGNSGLLGAVSTREALSMAIERNRLPDAFSLAGWTTTATLLPEQLEMTRPPSQPAWAGLGIEERRGFARQAVTAWVKTFGRPAPLRIALPSGSGSNLLFRILRDDFRAIGVPLVRVAEDADADLRLIDEVAPYDSALWYLGRLSCAHDMVCSQDATDRLLQAQNAQSIDEMLAKLGEAEAMTLANYGYIPLAAPVRWSLVSRRLKGFQPSPRGRHPLNHLLPEAP